MKIDIYCHIIPSKYIEAVERLTPLGPLVRDFIPQAPTLNDLERRFRIMDKYDDYVQVLTVSSFHLVAYRDKAVELAKIANDEIAELVSRYPERFVAGVANLPMNDMDAALMEVDRAVNELKLRGVEIWATRDGRPIDSPEYMPFYEKMSQYNLPIWIHPQRGATVSDYSNEKESKYYINRIFGWPYETTVAMTRLVFSRVFDKYPNIKFITHHCGGMVPYFADRFVSHINCSEIQGGDKYWLGLTKHPIEYFRMFFNDTALNGGASSLMCAYDFFGVDHLLFATDMPFDRQLGDSSVGRTIQAIQQMAVSDPDKQKIFEHNARRLLRLPV